MIFGLSAKDREQIDMKSGGASKINRTKAKN